MAYIEVRDAEDCEVWFFNFALLCHTFMRYSIKKFVIIVTGNLIVH